MDQKLLSISGPRQADRQRATLNQWTKTSKWTQIYSQSVDQGKSIDKELLSISGPRQADGHRSTPNQWTKASRSTKSYSQSVDQDKLMDKVQTTSNPDS